MTNNLVLRPKIVVTGCSRGLGLHIIDSLLAAGEEVIGISRRSSRELDLRQEKYAKTLVHLCCDLGEPASVREFLASRISSDTAIGGLVNNAAFAYDDLATNLDLERVEEMFRVNVLSPMELSRWAIRQMLLHRVRGSLVHISSVSAHTGYKGLAMYASTKGALEAYSKNLAREWGQFGIRSNCVVSGFMSTGMASSLNEEQRSRIRKRTALKRETNPSCVADTVTFLLGSKSASITGQNYFVDSGTT